MGFSAKQLSALRRGPEDQYIRSRQLHGRDLTYLEGWYAISEANRIFGFDGWSRETVESRCVLAREKDCVGITNYSNVGRASSPFGRARTRLRRGSSGATVGLSFVIICRFIFEFQNTVEGGRSSSLGYAFS